MMPLAILMSAEGAAVSGCDRSFDRDPVDERIDPLRSAGVTITPETHIPSDGTVIVLSTAIESTHPALARGNPRMHRSEVLAAMVASGRGYGRLALLVGGSSGKTSTSAMIAWILHECGRDPWAYVGAGIAGGAGISEQTGAGGASDFCKWGARAGSGPIVVEVDESDGSIARFTPDLAVITSVSHDHKSLDEIRALLTDFVRKAGGALLSEQASNQIKEARSEVVPKAPEPWSPLIGDFNRINESLAIAAVARAGVPHHEALAALRTFPGVKRRLEVVASSGDRYVIDDYAHNPEKIAAALSAVRSFLPKPFRCLLIFQPHGFQPTQIHKEAWARVFSEFLTPPSKLMLLPIYYAGGTVDRSISSEEVRSLTRGVDAEVAIDRGRAVAVAVEFLRERGGAVVVMGARDPSLSALARSISLSA